MTDDASNAEGQPDQVAPANQIEQTTSQVLEPEGQALVILIATGAAFLYGFITQVCWLGVVNVNWWPVIGLWVAVALLNLGIMNPEIIRKTAIFLLPWVESIWRRGKPRKWGVRVIALFALSITCAVLLGYFTLYTGGAFRSPYAQALLALALLSPQLATIRETIVVMFLVVIATYITFGLIGIYDLRPVPPIPDSLVGCTTVMTVFVALFNPVFGRPTGGPAEWRYMHRRVKTDKASHEEQ